MADEIAFENGRISNFERLVTMTLTLDRVILHHSLTSTYMPNFIKIEETFCGQTKVQTNRRTDGHLRPTLLGRLRRVDLQKLNPVQLCCMTPTWKRIGTILIQLQGSFTS